MNSTMLPIVIPPSRYIPVHEPHHPPGSPILPPAPPTSPADDHPPGSPYLPPAPPTSPADDHPPGSPILPPAPPTSPADDYRYVNLSNHFPAAMPGGGDALRQTIAMPKAEEAPTAQDEKNHISTCAIEEESSSDEDTTESTVGHDQQRDPSDAPPKVKIAFKRIMTTPTNTPSQSLLTTALEEPYPAPTKPRAIKTSQRPRLSMPDSPSAADLLDFGKQSGVELGRRTIFPWELYGMESTHHLVLSARETRRNMFQNELTDFLRFHILWERRTKYVNMKNGPQEIDDSDCFPGFLQYHESGW